MITTNTLTVVKHYLMKVSLAGEKLAGPHGGWFSGVLRKDYSVLLLDQSVRGCDTTDLVIEQFKEMPEPEETKDEEA